MRPGLVFVGLFAVLFVLYALLRDSLGTLTIFLLQLALVLVVLAGAGWFRYSKRRKGWFFFGEDGEDDEDGDRPHDSDDADSEIRKAS